MLAKEFVRATVVDIQGHRPELPEQVALDANVLYFVFYPNFSEIQLAGGKLPHVYQRTQYSNWINLALQAGVECVTAAQTLERFADGLRTPSPKR